MLLPLLALAWLFSFAAIAAWDWPWWLAPAIAAVAVPLVARLGGARPAVICALVALAAVAGGLRYEFGGPATPPPFDAFGVELSVEGTVASEPDPGLRTVSYRVDGIRLDGGESASLLITVNQFLELLPGDRVALRGEIDEPPSDLDGFDYRAYLLGEGIVGRMLFPAVDVIDTGSAHDVRRQSARWRLHLERALQRALPEPEASLAAGIAVGRDDAMPRELVDDFRAAGLAHLTAVSGGNVAILAALVFALTVPLVGRQWAVFPAVLLVAAYLAAAGFAPSIVRASIMAWIFLVGLLLGRPQSGLAGLGAAAIAMTAFEPGIAHDPGFQLSLAASAGLIAFSPWLEVACDLLLRRSRLGGIAGSLPSQAFVLTASATVATLPLVAYTFGRVSLIGLIANVVVAPLFVAAFVLGLGTAMAGTIWEPAGWALGLAAYFPLAAIKFIAERAAAMPGAAVTTTNVGSTATISWIAAYCVVGWLLYRRFAPRPAPWRPSARAALVRRGALAVSMGGLAAWIGVASVAPIVGPGELEVYVLDVGQGDAILMRTPGGRNILIDGGPSALAIAQQLGEVLPHWERRIDLVVLTHPHEDHVAGLVAVLDRYNVGAIASSGAINPTFTTRAFTGRAGPVLALAAGDRIVLDDVAIDVLWPPASAPLDRLNDSSIVLRVRYGEAVALLTGDIELVAQEQLLLSRELGAQVLKVPHHGAATSVQDFFRTVGAAVAIIPVGEDNQFGHPSNATLAALAPATVYRTDANGRVVLRTDGSQWRVSSER